MVQCKLYTSCIDLNSCFFLLLFCLSAHSRHAIPFIYYIYYFIVIKTSTVQLKVWLLPTHTLDDPTVVAGWINVPRNKSHYLHTVTYYIEHNSSYYKFYNVDVHIYVYLRTQFTICTYNHYISIHHDLIQAEFIMHSCGFILRFECTHYAQEHIRTYKQF